jgi:hypothetical protein
MHKLLRNSWMFDADADGGGNAGEKKTLKEWQAELDGEFAARGKQGASAKEKEILKALGVTTLDEATAKLKKATDAEAAQQTELQKAQAAVNTEKTRADQAEAERKAALARADEKLLRAAVMTVAAAAGVDDTELKTLWLLLKDDAGLRAKITPKPGDEDEFDGLEAVVKGLLKDHPKWLKSEGNQQIDINAGVRGAGGQKLSTEELAKRKRSSDSVYSSL